MSQKPDLSLLSGEAWAEAVALEEEAQAEGVRFSLPKLEQRLAAGAVVKIFDRTNAVFYLGLFQAEVGASLKDLEPLAQVPRAMFLLAGLADLEAQLKGGSWKRKGAVLTGAPEEQDGLENFLSMQSATAWLSKEGEEFLITLRGVDYRRLEAERRSGGRDPSAPEPQLDEVFRGRSLKTAYIQAARFGEQVRLARYADKGLEAPPLKAPFLAADIELSPRGRVSELADPELG